MITRNDIIAAAFALHILLVLFCGGLIELGLFANDALESLLDKEPLVFELQEPNRPKQVIETPEDAKVTERPKDPQFASDKNALARNSETDPNLDIGAPFAKGDFEFPELPTEQGPIGQPAIQAEANRESNEISNSQNEVEEEQADYFVDNRKSDFNREFLTKPRESMRAGVSENIPKARYDNQKTRMPDMGGLSFNTYDWDFAPYMLYLKKKIGGNVYPPAAMYRMGIIKGQTLLRFKIFPNGELRDLELLEYEGHHTLMKTSVSAVEISAPFPVLPDDFPEPYLSVTARFSYYISGR